MRQGLIATAALLTFALSAAHADYVIIRVYSKSSGGMGGLGIGGEQPIGIMGVPPSGQLGLPGIGIRGGGEGQPPMGQFGFRGAGGGQFGQVGGEGQPPMGQFGFRGGQGPPGPIGPPSGGFQGRFGNLGAGGGLPPMGIQGEPGLGVMGMPPVGALGGQPGVSSNNFVTVLVEVKKSQQAPSGWRRVAIRPLTDPVMFMDTKYGTTAIYDDDPSEVALQLIPAKLPKDVKTGPTLKSPIEQYTDRRNEFQKSRDRAPEKYLAEAIWCLRVGLPDKCVEYLTALENSLAKTPDKNSVPKHVADALAAYAKIKPILENQIEKKDKATAWKERLGYKSLATHDHYALIHNSQDSARDGNDRDGIDRRLKALENNFKTFYLLFAMKGRALPAPKEKLVTILVADGETFARQKELFNVNELVSDGIYARQQNLAIFSPTRLDVASHTFARTMQDAEREFELNLLAGKLPPLGDKDQAPRTMQRVRRAQTLALVDRALREESEIASATHEGTLQLVAETGLLPRNAPAPEWLRFGLASLFEMPKGPFPGRSQSMVRLAFWPGAGGPNWAWRLYFDEMQQDGLIVDPAVDLFYTALTDAWFEFARDMERNKKEGEDISESKAICLARARTLSWSLTYYLFQHRFAEFEKFLQDLSNLPRDTELDHYTLVTTFLRNFGYDTTGLTPKDPRGKLDRYLGVSKSWVASIRNDPAPTVDLKLEQVAPVDPNNPMGPEGPIGPTGPGPIGPGGPGPMGPGGLPGGRPGGGS